ncbi:hypothetical protein NAT02_05475 [Aeromonas hydrophila]|jgi:hypothetical protein|uniref:hypothetical protein n=1 Tax=Aeromonas hydrophila TaxID=644 RepID=UPI001A1A32C4|nr:hypothetical protein [Aeromonas hydrophila]MCP3242325.1 hypothetical protein [Aeromonas hydrophila]HAU4899104.1 hypothetical protein [Aeromonas hydrophila]
MKIAWLGLGLCLLAQPGCSKDNPTAECSWLYDRIAALEQAIKQGDELGTREELARWRAEFKKKACQQYDY